MRAAARTVAPGPHWRVLWRRRVAKYSRWLHVYVSMACFVIVWLFAITGVTLNHAEWFAGQERTLRYEGTLDTAWTGAQVDRLRIVELFRRAHGIRGAVSDFHVDDGQCSVSFKGPGYSADAFVDRKTGKYEVTESRLGLAAVLNDLHKGRDTGSTWKAVIDLSAGLLTFVSLSGLILIYFIHKHRTAGLLSLAAGGVMTYLIYLVSVP